MPRVSMEEPLWESTKIVTNVIPQIQVTSQYSDCYCTPTPCIHIYIYIHAWFVANKIII